MILSVAKYRGNIAWFFEVFLTTSPTLVTIEDRLGERSIPFSISGNKLSFSAQTSFKKFSIKIDTEPKVMSFGDDEEEDEEEKEGSVKLEINQSNGSLVLPLGDLSKIRVEYFTPLGERIVVPERQSTINASNLTYKGKTYGGGIITRPTHYLVNSDTDTWATFTTSIPFRVVVTNLAFPFNTPLANMYYPAEFYKATEFYADKGF